MAARPTTILRRIERALGPLVPPPRLDPVDELVLTILSQNTSDTNRDRAWTALRERFASWDDVMAADAREVEDAIRPGGLAATKAPRIQAVLGAIRDETGSIDLSALHDLDDTNARELLARLPGVGPKTAACVLAFSLGRPAIPVDTHVHRTSIRLGLVPPRTGAGPAHRVLEALVRPADRLALHVALITLGRRVCKAGRPLCGACPVRDLCPRIGVASAGP